MAQWKILLAEDDMDDQKIFLDFLTHHPDLIVMPIVENGEELLQCLNTIEDEALLPDLIILDQNMPKRNGLQTLEVLKKAERFSHIPVMVYSTYTDQQLISKASGMGAYKVVAKPFTKDGYLKMMEDFLQVFSN